MLVVPLWGSVTVVLLVWIAGLLVRWLAWMKLAKRSERAMSGDAIVTGTVVADTPPVVNEVRQLRFKSQHGWRWSEVSFQSTSQSFALHSDDGKLVTVDPRDPVLLLWTAEHTVAIGDGARNRVARIEPGDKVEILGWFETSAKNADAAAPYRDGVSATLTLPRRCPMLVSRKPLAPMLRAMGRFQLRRAALLLGLVSLVQALAGHLWEFEIHALGQHGLFANTRLVLGIAGGILAIAFRDQQPPWNIGQSPDEYEARRRA